MDNWKSVASLEECPPGACLERVVGDRIVALFNVDGEVFALDGVCPHQGGPLGQGELRANIVTCPWHGWQFDVRTGHNLVNSQIRQPYLPTRVIENIIQVECASE